MDTYDNQWESKKSTNGWAGDFKWGVGDLQYGLYCAEFIIQNSTTQATLYPTTANSGSSFQTFTKTIW